MGTENEPASIDIPVLSRVLERAERSQLRLTDESEGEEAVRRQCVHEARICRAMSGNGSGSGRDSDEDIGGLSFSQDDSEDERGTSNTWLAPQTSDEADFSSCTGASQ